MAKVNGKVEDRAIKELHHDGIITTKSDDIAEVLNQFFKPK